MVDSCPRAPYSGTQNCPELVGVIGVPLRIPSRVSGSCVSHWWKVSGVRVLIVFATVIVSILLGPLFSEVISLVGAFSMCWSRSSCRRCFT